MKILLALLLAAPAAATVQLEGASALGSAAVAAGSPESASALSAQALDGGRLDASARGAVYAGDASKKPSLTFSPVVRKTAAEPPAPFRAASRSDNDHAGAFFLAGLAAPVVGAIGGAILGGGVGAVVGVLIGAGVGIALLLVGLCKALRRIFNP